MSKRARKILYEWINFVAAVCTIGSVIMAIYKFIVLMAQAASVVTYSIEELASPVAAWSFVAGVAAVIYDKSNYENLDDEDDYIDEDWE